MHTCSMQQEFNKDSVSMPLGSSSGQMFYSSHSYSVLLKRNPQVFLSHSDHFCSLLKVFTVSFTTFVIWVFWPHFHETSVRSLTWWVHVNKFLLVEYESNFLPKIIKYFYRISRKFISVSIHGCYERIRTWAHRNQTLGGIKSPVRFH